MAKFIDTAEITQDLGQVITDTLKKHGIAVAGVQVKVMDDQLRILVPLEEE